MTFARLSAVVPSAVLLAAALVAAPGCVEEEIGTEAQAMEMGGGDMDHACPGHAPIMITGDFNGNGVIDSGDIGMIDAYIEAGDYAAYFDMNVDGALDGKDVSTVAGRMGDAAHARDVQMAQLFAEVEPYRDIRNAYAAGFTPFTPDLQGHGIHFANLDRVYSWGARGGFQAGVPEGLNYTASGELVAAFYYAPGAIDLYDYGYQVPPDTYFQSLPPPGMGQAFVDGSHHDWHNHVGPCFGGNTCPVPGFDQCVTERTCYDEYGGTLWSPKFHMLHVWMFELNHCGPFAGIDMDVSMMAPPEPNHGDCNLQDIVPVVVNEPDVAPLGFEPNECYGG